VPLVADVTKSAEVEGAISRIIKDFGALHVLVNNLGDSIRKPLVPLPGHEGRAGGVLTDEEYRLILDLNLTEAVLCTRAVGPHMLARRSGKIINIGSFASPGRRQPDDLCRREDSAVGFTPRWRSSGRLRVQVNSIARASPTRSPSAGGAMPTRSAAPSRPCRCGRDDPRGRPPRRHRVGGADYDGQTSPG
jgi:NAD(P)-dependent dehydrogenase (short-subunit alcohol dehydrogenase family)